jgi:plastocyanin
MMKVPYGIMMVVVFFAVAACQHMGLERGPGERSGIPTVTRTGEVKDIIIRDDNVSPAIVIANPGDEIRWVNNRQGHTRVIFLLPAGGQLSCQRGFGWLMSADWNSFKNRYTAKLGINDSASVCFKSPSEIKYVVRADLRSGEEHVAGTINIRGGHGPSDIEDLGKRTSQVSEQH